VVLSDLVLTAAPPPLQETLRSAFVHEREIGGGAPHVERLPADPDSATLG